jgi:hypothetical protein
MKRAMIGLVALSLVVREAQAQETLLPGVGGGGGVGVSAWMFSKPVAQSGGGLQAAMQVAVPFRVRALFGRWTVDLSGAGAAGAALYKSNTSSSDGSSSGGGGDEEEMRVVSLIGPTDLKLRMTGAVLSENLILTLGLNLPTGKVGLSADETLALQVLGAPALAMPVGSLGTGAGATIGAIRAFEGDEWALAIGGSVEQRSQYSPLIFALDTGRAETRVTPGTAAHLTLGFDRSVGENRLSALLAADVFSKDQVQLILPSGREGVKEFQLGPQVALITRLDLAASAWRESGLDFAVRQRMEFKDSASAKTAGSGGTYFDVAFGGVRGGPDGRGFVIGVDGRWQSGLKFTDALIGAAATSVGVSFGWETLRRSTATRVVLHPQFASFDTGKAKATGIGVTLGISIGARREAQ